MPNDLMRFSVAMPEDLLMDFDELVARRGVARNRSEVVRDLVREALDDQARQMPGEEVMGSLTIVYDHHATDLQDKLHLVQHNYLGNVVASTHVHVSHALCMEVIILRGESTLVHSLADSILGLKGVKNGKLVVTSILE